MTIFLQVHFFCKHVHVHCASMYYPCFNLFTVFYIDTRYPKHALCIHVPWYSKICYTFIADYKTSRPTLQCNIDLHMYKYMYLQWIQYNRYIKILNEIFAIHKRLIFYGSDRVAGATVCTTQRFSGRQRYRGVARPAPGTRRSSVGGQTVPQSSPHGVCTAQYCTACYLINSTILLYF